MKRASERPFQVNGRDACGPVQSVRAIGLCGFARGSGDRLAIRGLELDPSLPGVGGNLCRARARKVAFSVITGDDIRILNQNLGHTHPHCVTSNWQTSHARPREVCRLQSGPIVPRCLIVDDDRDGREGFAEYLRAFGFEVIECADGETGWRKVAEAKPDILLLDLQLPQLSGWDLVRRIRLSEIWAGLPIVAFSACVFPEDQLRAAEVGCDVFIAKPAVPADVLAQLQKLLSSHAR